MRGCFWKQVNGFGRCCWWLTGLCAVQVLPPRCLLRRWSCLPPRRPVTRGPLGPLPASDQRDLQHRPLPAQYFKLCSVRQLRHALCPSNYHTSQVLACYDRKWGECMQWIWCFSFFFLFRSLMLANAYSANYFWKLYARKGVVCSKKKIKKNNVQWHNLPHVKDLHFK